MKADEIRDYEDAHIRERIGELQEELFRLRFRSATMALENPKLISQIRRDIARMKTILREREIAREREAAGEAEGAETAAATASES